MSFIANQEMHRYRAVKVINSVLTLLMMRLNLPLHRVERFEISNETTLQATKRGLAMPALHNLKVSDYPAAVFQTQFHNNVV